MEKTKAGGDFEIRTDAAREGVPCANGQSPLGTGATGGGAPWCGSWSLESHCLQEASSFC